MARNSKGFFIQVGCEYLKFMLGESGRTPGNSVGHRFGAAGRTIGGVKPTLASSTIYNQDESKNDSPVSATRNIYGLHRKDTNNSAKTKESPLVKLKAAVDTPKVGHFYKTSTNAEVTPSQSK